MPSQIIMLSIHIHNIWCRETILTLFTLINLCPLLYNLLACLLHQFTRDQLSHVTQIHTLEHNLLVLVVSGLGVCYQFASADLGEVHKGGWTSYYPADDPST